MPFSPLRNSSCRPPKPPAERRGFPDGTESLVPPTYTEVSGSPSTAGDLFRDLAAADPQEMACNLAALNILLDQRGKDAAIQQRAVERYVRANFRSIPVDPSQPRPTYAFIMNRIGTMIAFKGLAGIERSGGTSRQSDPYLTGDMVLRANQFVSGVRFDGIIDPQTDADLAAETISTWDLTNPRDIGYEVPGVYRMFELLDEPDATVTTLKNKLGIVTADSALQD